MIHKFKAKDICILLDTNSGGVHVIDDVTFDLLDHAEPPFEKECPKNVMDIFKRKLYRRRDKGSICGYFRIVR